MPTFQNLNPTRLTFLLALVGAVTLAACGQAEDPRTAGQQLDSAIADVKQVGNDVRQEAKQAAARAEVSVEQSAAAAAAAVSDATISAKITAALAVDDQLKVTRIDVFSTNGEVTLEGTAPNADALARATVLAKAVNGVRAVDNRLVVAKHG